MIGRVSDTGRRAHPPHLPPRTPPRYRDTDGDGEVSRKEFHKAMPLLGFDASKKDIDDLFSQWDTDGGGSLDFGELKKILTSATRSGSADAKKRAEQEKIKKQQKGRAS